MVLGHANPDRWGGILLELRRGSLWRALQPCKRTAVIAEHIDASEKTPWRMSSRNNQKRHQELLEQARKCSAERGRQGSSRLWGEVCALCSYVGLGLPLACPDDEPQVEGLSMSDLSHWLDPRLG